MPYERTQIRPSDGAEITVYEDEDNGRYAWRLYAYAEIDDLISFKVGGGAGSWLTPEEAWRHAGCEPPKEEEQG